MRYSIPFAVGIAGLLRL